MPPSSSREGSKMPCDLGCSRELAFKLGAIEAVNRDHFKAMRESETFFLCRDPETMQVLFWPLTTGLIVSRWPPRPPRESGP